MRRASLKLVALRCKGAAAEDDEEESDEECVVPKNEFDVLAVLLLGAPALASNESNPDGLLGDLPIQVDVERVVE